jgi:UDP-N-acetylmuramoyl-tripeptide--D-alanyl-D-alanine ligase
MKMTLAECANIVQGRLVGENVAFDSVSIDTRAIQTGQLYVAIKGHQFDGNAFVEQAELAGAIAAIVHQGVKTPLPHIVVADTRLALAELAGAWRKKLAVSVVGVTGSNGKTTVKEMTAAILGVHDAVLYTQGNLNNDIGVPLTLLRLNEQHRYAVIEMGANHPKEIKYTSSYAAHDVGVLNNAGAAHIAGFLSVEGVAKAKAEIIETLKADGTAVLNRDDQFFDYWQSVAASRKVISFGLHETANVRAENIAMTLVNQQFFTRFDLLYQQQRIVIALKLAGQHNVVNALAAAAASLALGISLEQIKQGLENVKPVTGRMQPYIGRLGNLIIDDTYNANAASLKAGVKVLLECAGKPWVVLGAFGELGEDSAAIHREIGEFLKTSGVQHLFATGDDARHTVATFGDGARFFDSQEELIMELTQELKGNETLLVKGSRARRMERVVAALVDNFRI